jgi:hypothetical protein
MKKCYKRSRKRGEYLQTIKGRKDNWICHILRRNCLLIQVIEGKIRGKIKSDGKKTSAATG